MTKFCVDCKFYKPPGRGKIPAHCVRPTDNYDMVHGEMIPYRNGAFDERTNEHPNYCGPDAKFFEPKKRGFLSGLFK